MVELFVLFVLNDGRHISMVEMPDRGLSHFFLFRSTFSNFLIFSFSFSEGGKVTLFFLLYSFAFLYFCFGALVLCDCSGELGLEKHKKRAS